jgi:hypothetical protein
MQIAIAFLELNIILPGALIISKRLDIISKLELSGLNIPQKNYLLNLRHLEKKDDSL